MNVNANDIKFSNTFEANVSPESDNDSIPYQIVKIRCIFMSNGIRFIDTQEKYNNFLAGKWNTNLRACHDSILPVIDFNQNNLVIIGLMGTGCKEPIINLGKIHKKDANYTIEALITIFKKGEKICLIGYSEIFCIIVPKYVNNLVIDENATYVDY